MDLNEYQDKAVSTAVYPYKWKLIYPSMGLVSEAGEVIGKIKKVLRGDTSLGEVKDKIKKELGDTLWYLAVTAADLGLSLESIAQENLEKLADRKERGTLKGSGDDR